MKKKTKIGLIIFVLVIVVVVLISGCLEEEPSPVVEKEEPTDLRLPESRSFYIGMTPWPYDFTLEALEETYETIKSIPT